MLLNIAERFFLLDEWREEEEMGWLLSRKRVFFKKLMQLNQGQKAKSYCGPEIAV